VIIVLLALSLSGYFLIPPILGKQNARNKLLPAIQKLVDDNFRPPTEAFDLALQAEKYIAGDSALIKLWPTVASTTSIETTPAGAEVFWKDYHTPDAAWRKAGTTPLKDVRFPRGYLRVEIRKQGYQTIEYAGHWPYARIGLDIAKLKMDKSGSLPENMVRIPKKTTSMYIVGLDMEKRVGEFLKTNSGYQQTIQSIYECRRIFQQIILELSRLFQWKRNRAG
jgi:hypothetical protein